MALLISILWADPLGSGVVPELHPVVRTERVSDIEAIREVLTAAFDGDEEAQLVDILRSQGGVLVSMIAELAGVVVWHLAFTRAHIEWGDAEQPVAALGPMAVSSMYQRQGIGGKLVNAGLAACRSRGERVVVVLGHSAYYPKFGFVPADRYGLRCEFAAPPEAFMVLPFNVDALTRSQGLVKYHATFHDF